MFETTKARDQVAQLASSKPAEALRVARMIADPWFAVQAFAWVARFASGDVGEGALVEARETAKAGRDAYHKSAVLAWPIRAAVETGRLDAARAMLDMGLALLPKVRPPASRAEAGGLLLEAAFPAGRKIWEPVLRAIEDHCRPGNDWRSQRLYRSLSQIVSLEDMDAARRLIAALPDGKTKSRAEKELAEGVTMTPRAFFEIGG
ncbi:MAG: hypothetical protein AB7L90_15440 [Hyphomicrobiaceae bacterium]